MGAKLGPKKIKKNRMKSNENDCLVKDVVKFDFFFFFFFVNSGRIIRTEKKIEIEYEKN